MIHTRRSSFLKFYLRLYFNHCIPSAMDRTGLRKHRPNEQNFIRNIFKSEPHPLASTHAQVTHFETWSGFRDKYFGIELISHVTQLITSPVDFAYKGFPWYKFQVHAICRSSDLVCWDWEKCVKTYQLNTRLSDFYKMVFTALKI